jgi:hypothetical protein
MTKIASKWSNGDPNNQWNTRRYDDDKLDNIQVNSLNVNAYTSEITALATTGFTITPAMTDDNDIFFVSNTAAVTDIIKLSDDFPVGTLIHLFATERFNLRTETATDGINAVASKGWAVPAVDDILHCLKTHATAWIVTEETKAGLDVAVIAAT